MVDMPEGTALEDDGARRVGAGVGRAGRRDGRQRRSSTSAPSAPYNFNGLVRHYFLRRAPHLADLQVNLVPKGERSAQSHEIAGRDARAAAADRQAVRRHASRSRKCRRGRPCCRPWSPKSTDRIRARRTAVARASQGDLRADRRRGRYRLVRRGAASEGHARGRWRESRGRRALVGGGRARWSGWPASGEIGGPAARRRGAGGRADRDPPAARRSQPRGGPVAPAARHAGRWRSAS